MIPSNCGSVGIKDIESTKSNIIIYPNPFSTFTTITLNDLAKTNNVEIKMYNVLGEVVLSEMLSKQSNTFETSQLPSGIYIYKIISNNNIIQSGRLISNK